MSDLPTYHKYENSRIMSVIIKNQGNLSASARELNMPVRAIQRRMEKYPEMKERIDDYIEDIVDLAMDGLKKGILNGNSRLIEFALDRLGQRRGFIKQTSTSNIHVTGDPEKPITIDKNINMEGMSVEEKIVLMKLFKNKTKDEKVETQEPIELSEVVDTEDSGSIYSMIEEEE